MAQGARNVTFAVPVVRSVISSEQATQKRIGARAATSAAVKCSKSSVRQLLTRPQVCHAVQCSIQPFRRPSKVEIHRR